jgi:subtilase family serine protease
MMAWVAIKLAIGKNQIGRTKYSSVVSSITVKSATSPYVTAVGGVVLEGNNLIGDQISSGGFSNYFARPSYQVRK